MNERRSPRSQVHAGIVFSTLLVVAMVARLQSIYGPMLVSGRPFDSLRDEQFYFNHRFSVWKERDLPLPSGELDGS